MVYAFWLHSSHVTFVLLIYFNIYALNSFVKLTTDTISKESSKK